MERRAGRRADPSLYSCSEPPSMSLLTSSSVQHPLKVERLLPTCMNLPLPLPVLPSALPSVQTTPTPAPPPLASPSPSHSPPHWTQHLLLRTPHPPRYQAGLLTATDPQALSPHLLSLCDPLSLSPCPSSQVKPASLPSGPLSQILPFLCILHVTSEASPCVQSWSCLCPAHTPGLGPSASPGMPGTSALLNFLILCNLGAFGI